MSEVETQESQKTVVAFISGLLIGGLLVWVFSSSPESAIAPVEQDNETTEVENVETETTTEVEEEVSRPVVGEGSIIIEDQAAGNTVTISSLELPTAHGWVVVREFIDGSVGNILGAARFSVEENLVPETIELIRGTTAGGSYQVVFFTNGGDTKFDLGEDLLIDSIATTFEAN